MIDFNNKTHTCAQKNHTSIHTIERTTTPKQTEKKRISKKKLTKENEKFLKLIGLK